MSAPAEAREQAKARTGCGNWETHPVLTGPITAGKCRIFFLIAVSSDWNGVGPREDNLPTIACMLVEVDTVVTRDRLICYLVSVAQNQISLRKDLSILAMFTRYRPIAHLLLVSLVLSSGCSQTASSNLANATYRGIAETPTTLTDGQWVAPLSAGRRGCAAPGAD